MLSDYEDVFKMLKEALVAKKPVSIRIFKDDSCNYSHWTTNISKENIESLNANNIYNGQPL